MGRAPAGIYMRRSAVAVYQPGMAAASAMGRAAMAHVGSRHPLLCSSCAAASRLGQPIAGGMHMHVQRSAVAVHQPDVAAAFMGRAAMAHGVSPIPS
eukprot:363857-Chlamydomonas_euryale.AAC.6